MQTTKIFCALALAGFATLGQAAQLYSNGAVANGAGLSILGTTDTTLGTASSISLGYSVADNFTVTGAGWNVASLDFYAYQTSAAGFTFTNVAYTIVSGADVNTGTVVASGTVAAINDGLAGYRVSSTTLTSTSRAIYKIGADIPDITLAAGSYFLTWSLAGTSASGPFVPSVVDASTGVNTDTGNALQSPSGAGGYVAVLDGNSAAPLDLPFTITGTTVTAAVPEPASLTMMLAGVLGVGTMIRRRKASSQA